MNFSYEYSISLRIIIFLKNSAISLLILSFSPYFRVENPRKRKYWSINFNWQMNDGESIGEVLVLSETCFLLGMIEKAEMKGIYLGKKAELPFSLNGNGLFYAQHG